MSLKRSNNSLNNKSNKYNKVNLSSKPGKYNKNKNNNKNSDNIPSNNIDDFHNNRNKVSLSTKSKSKHEEDDLFKSDEDDNYMNLEIDSEESEEENNEEDVTTGWGNKKNNYYGNNGISIAENDDEDDDNLEELEARRLQSETLKDISENDFIDKSIDDYLDSKKDTSIKDKKNKKLQEEDFTLTLQDSIPTDLSLNVSGPSIVSIKSSTVISKLSQSEQLELLNTRYPEMLPLITGILAELSELDIFKSILLKKKELSENGLKYVNLKIDILTSSVTLTLYYILSLISNKTNNKPIKMLLQLRALNDDLSEIEARNTDQVEFLSQNGKITNKKMEEFINSQMLRFKQDSEDEKETLEEEEDVEEEPDREIEGDDFASEGSEEDEDVEENMDDHAEMGEESENEEVMDEFEAKLLGLGKSSTSIKSQSKSDSSSVVTSLKPKTKNLPTQSRESADEFDELDEDGEIDDLIEHSGDEDLADMMDEELGSDAEEEEKPKAKKDKKDKKDIKDKKPKAKKGELLPAPANLKFRDDTLAAGDRRAPGYAISKNRGLMPYRKHGSSNSRVVLKNKYEKAKKRLSSTHKTYKGKEDNYGGERSGIKTHLAKSIRLT